jgi:membrane-associated phospholipid phosphatase
MMKNILKYFILFLLCSSASIVNAQKIDKIYLNKYTMLHQSSKKMFQLNSNQKVEQTSISGDISTAWSGTKNVIARPFHWDSGDLLTFGIWSAAVVGAVFIDMEVRDMFRRNQNDFSSTFLDIGYTYGSPTFTAPVTILTYTVGALIKDQKVKETGVMMTELLLTTLLVQQPLRVIVGRARPYTNEDNLTFNPFTTDGEYGSFISGHTWSAVGLSYILAEQIDHPVATAILYTLAIVTPISRMADDKHWFSDVLIGGALGYYSARSIVKSHKDGSKNELLIIPTSNGLSLVYRF